MRITIWQGCKELATYEIDPGAGSVDIDPFANLAYQKSKDQELRWLDSE